jgi:tryptophan halogenase
MSNNKKIVVVGGGTSGFITALLAKKMMNENVEITVIASEEIGVLGAGEGTTPNFVHLLKILDVDLDQFVTETKSTFKNGIKFENFHNDKTFYYHNFAGSHNSPSFVNIQTEDSLKKINAWYMLNIANDIPEDTWDFVCHLNNKNKSPFLYSVYQGENNSLVSPVPLVSYALHFNAIDVAKFFKKLSEERGISIIDDIVTDFVSDQEGNITKIVLQNGSKIDSDFVFDCTGFKRLIIGKHFNSKWKSYKDILTTKAALPYFLPKAKTGELPPYTRSIAMKYGWMWQIPLQDRFGCGYVFDSDLVSEEEVTKEIEEFLGFVPEYPRKGKGAFSFSPGCFETTWVKNCVAVGLSSGFIEPLEATSINNLIESLYEILFDTSRMFNRDQRYIDRYNKKTVLMNDEILNFVYFHYLGDRNDTEFWERFKDPENMPSGLKKVLDEWEYAIPSYEQFDGKRFFTHFSWWEVARGLNKLNTDLIKSTVKSNNLPEILVNKFFEIRKDQEFLSNHFEDHSSFLLEISKNQKSTI